MNNQLAKLLLRNMQVGASHVVKAADTPAKIDGPISNQDVQQMQDEREQKQEEKVNTQTESLQAVGELLAKMTELNNSAFDGAKPEIKALGENIQKQLAQLSTLMNMTVVEHQENAVPK